MHKHFTDLGFLCKVSRNVKEGDLENYFRDLRWPTENGPIFLLLRTRVCRYQ
eukprot:UN16508